MLMFKCRDMAIDCNFVATAETRDGIIGLALEHALEVHGDLLASLSPEQSADVNNLIDAVIKEVPARG